ncbi:MAG: BMP family ABC transporter substrate-binding protein, partial [Clostridia bacterium]|nr:BMP family ABC transporter substrate-binding protein [Clostridia bacterium]
LKAAKQFPNTQFCHATGTKAHTENRGNFQNAFASIYEGRYLAGVAAGLKLKDLYGDDITDAEAKIGYVGAFPYAEVKSGYTSFYLGVKSIVPNVTMDVKFTSSWYDYDKEKEAAEALIASGCTLISQHADSMGAPTACFEADIPNVCYNVDSRTMTNDTRINNSYIIASKINWAPYFRYMINCVMTGTEIADDWTGTMQTGSVEVLTLNETAAAPGTQAKLNEVKASLEEGTLKVFDCSKFTVNGANLTQYLADVDDMGDYIPETNVIKSANGITYFAESEFRSAPYFDIDIDGITIK